MPNAQTSPGLGDSAIGVAAAVRVRSEPPISRPVPSQGRRTLVTRPNARSDPPAVHAGYSDRSSNVACGATVGVSLGGSAIMHTERRRIQFVSDRLVEQIIDG